MSGRDAKIVEMVLAGMRRFEVARRLGISKSAVSRATVPALGKAAAGRKPVYGDDAMRRLYEAGCSDREIARQIGSWSETVFQWRRRNRLPRVSRAAPGHVPEIVDRAAAGEPTRASPRVSA